MRPATPHLVQIRLLQMSMARKALPLLAIALLVGLLSVSWNIDRFKPRIERAFHDETGHALHIDGDIRLRLLPSPELFARDVSVANLPGGTRQAMIQAASIDVGLDPFALLAHRLEITQLALTRPDILLETVAGTPNWWLSHRAGPPGRSGSVQPPSRPLAIVIDEASLVAGRLTWNAPGRLGTGAVVVDRLHVRNEGDALTLAAAGRHGAESFTLSVGSTGDMRWSAPRPLRAELGLALAGERGHLVFDGTVTPARHAYDGQLHADLTRSALVEGLFPHAAVPAFADLSLRAGLVGQGTVAPRLETLGATASDIDLARVWPGLSLAHAALHATSSDAPLAVDLSGHLGTIPIAIAGTLGTLDALQTGGPGPLDVRLSLGGDTLAFEGSGARHAGQIDLRAHARLQAPDAGPVAALLGGAAAQVRSADGDLTFSGDARAFDAAFDARSLRIDRALFSDARLAASLDAARHLAAYAALAGRPPWLTLSDDLASGAVLLQADGQLLPAAPLLTLLTGDPIQGGALSLSATLHAHAPGGRLDRNSLSGPFTATVHGVTLPASLTKTLLGPLIGRAHLPPVLAASTWRVDCATMTGSVQDARLTFAGFSAASSLVDADGHGSVDLAARTIALSLRPTLHAGPTALSTQATVTGPLDRPAIALAPGSNGRFGLTIGGAPASSGACAGSRPKLPNAATLLRALGIVR